MACFASASMPSSLRSSADFLTSIFFSATGSGLASAAGVTAAGAAAGSATGGGRVIPASYAAFLAAVSAFRALDLASAASLASCSA